MSESEQKDGNAELNKNFTEIIIHFSDFLSKHSVYEAAPENSKVLVFNSDLSFKEMVKAFINEDIYCALIYDSDKQYFIGLITISDILLLFKYIIEQTHQREILDYSSFIHEIFSTDKIIKYDNKKDNNSSKKNKNFDILKYLTKINFNDYWKIIKNKNYNLISISLDSSLLDVLKMIYKVGVHRLVVEETKKKSTGENKKKENEVNNQNKQNIQIDKKEEKKVENVKEKNEKEKIDKEKCVSEKKIKKIKNKKKSEENVEKEEEGKEAKEGEKVEKKVKKKKIKKKKTEEEEGKDKEKEDKEKEGKEAGKEEGEKSTKKLKVKKKGTKKKKETEENKENKEKESKEKKDEKKEEKNEEKKVEKIEENKELKNEVKKEEIKEDKKIEKKDEKKEEKIVEKKEEKKEEKIEEKKDEKKEEKIDEKKEEKTEISNKDNIKIEESKNNKENDKIDEKELSLETQNYTGFVTYETVFDFLIYNYYSIEMKEFNLTLDDLKKLPLSSSFIRPIDNFALMKDEVHSSFSKYITSKKDLLPILTNDKNDLFGFLYLRDYLYFISNCESNQSLTNEQFLSNMYEGIDDNKPYGKERIIYLEFNEESKKLRIKELLEKINAAPEKKIVLRDIEGGNKLYIISLNSIFDALVEKNKI